MRMMGIENALWLAGVVGEASVLAILIYRRAWRTLPFFFLFCAWEPVSDGAIIIVRHNLGGTGAYSAAYSIAYLTQAVIDSVLEFAVLVEIAWSVLRPIRSSLPRRTLPLIVVLLAGLGVAVWPLAGLHLPVDWDWSPILRTVVHVQQTASILRIALFLLLAGCSQLLSIGWRDRELQVATGLGFFSIVSLFAAIMHTPQTSVLQYSHLNQLVVGSYVCSLAYWVFSFLQKEAPRREFTPQMQNFLLAVAGVARAERAALSEAASASRQKNL
jgi:hypothetical protein